MNEITDWRKIEGKEVTGGKASRLDGIIIEMFKYSRKDAENI